MKREKLSELEKVMLALLIQNAPVDEFVEFPNGHTKYSGFKIRKWANFQEYHWELKHRSKAGKFWTYSKNDEYKTVWGCKRNLLGWLDLPEVKKAGFNKKEGTGE